MTRFDLIRTIAHSIGEHEGFFVTQQQAQARDIRWPTRAQRNRNPGNLRGTWNPKGEHDGPNPKTSYMIFKTEEAGWAALHKLCEQYLKGKYHGGQPPTLRQWFAIYAPAEDANNPESYAAGVAKALKTAGAGDVSVDWPLTGLIDG